VTRRDGESRQRKNRGHQAQEEEQNKGYDPLTSHTASALDGRFNALPLLIYRHPRNRFHPGKRAVDSDFIIVFAFFG